MATTKKKVAEISAPPDEKGQPPAGNIGYGHPEYHFVQHVVELQKTVTRIEVTLEKVEKSTEDTKAKVSRFEKVMYAAGVILVIAIGVGGWILNTAKDFALLHYRTTLEAQAKAAHAYQPQTPNNRVDDK